MQALTLLDTQIITQIETSGFVKLIHKFPFTKQIRIYLSKQLEADCKVHNFEKVLNKYSSFFMSWSIQRSQYNSGVTFHHTISVFITAIQMKKINNTLLLLISLKTSSEDFDKYLIMLIFVYSEKLQHTKDNCNKNK